jgi:hypothetical protein
LVDNIVSWWCILVESAGEFSVRGDNSRVRVSVRVRVRVRIRVRVRVRVRVRGMIPHVCLGSARAR